MTGYEKFLHPDRAQHPAFVLAAKIVRLRELTGLQFWQVDCRPKFKLVILTDQGKRKPPAAEPVTDWISVEELTATVDNLLAAAESKFA